MLVLNLVLQLVFSLVLQKVLQLVLLKFQLVLCNKLLVPLVVLLDLLISSSFLLVMLKLNHGN